MKEVITSRILRTIPLLIAVCFVSFPASAQYSGNTDTYVFFTGQSTVVQTGGIAGVNWTYSVKGLFQLTVEPDAGAASFAHVDTNATDDSPLRRTLDSNEVFNMTSLLGTVLDDTTISFTGKAADGSDVLITVTIENDLAYLVGQTTPPPNTADFFLFSLDAVAQRKYGGGTGEPNDPYRIATAEDLMLLGDTTDDYDKHFILTDDIDLDPNLPGRMVFDQAVIAPDTDPTPNENGNQQHDGKPFSGVFDGDGRTISHLTITGMGYLGVFGLVGQEAEVSNLRVIDVSIIGTDRSAGALIGLNRGEVTQCYSTGSVNGDGYVGGVVGRNEGTISASRSTAWASGEHNVGGLVGINSGSITTSYATGTIFGTSSAGGLAGANRGTISNSYSMSSVSGTYMVGGLVGWFYYGTISNSYSTGAVKGEFSVGGLVGCNGNRSGSHGTVLSSFWDTSTSNQNSSDGGTGNTMAEMQMASTFLKAGWDFVGETDNGTEDIWKITEGMGYPRLAWEKYSGGTGEPNDPYRIATAEDLMLLGETPEDHDKHFILTADIDLDPNLPGRKVFDKAVIAPRSTDGFTGFFNGNGLVISHLTIRGEYNVGLFGLLLGISEVKDLGLVDINVAGSGDYVGGLVGFGGRITNCYTSGSVSGRDSVGGLAGEAGGVTRSYSTSYVSGTSYVGGLVGQNRGDMIDCYSTGIVAGAQSCVGGLVGHNDGYVIQCYSTGRVSGSVSVGGLVGYNDWGSVGEVIGCYSSSTVDGNTGVGGLVGTNVCTVIDCYAQGSVSGNSGVGGLVGNNDMEEGMGGPATGYIARCYSTGQVAGENEVGGLVGYQWCGDIGEPRLNLSHIIYAEVAYSFWDIDTSGLTTSDGGTGKTTDDMQTASTFLEVGWDFVGETANGTEDIWWILEGQDYPRLWWELIEENFVVIPEN